MADQMMRDALLKIAFTVELAEREHDETRKAALFEVAEKQARKAIAAPPATPVVPEAILEIGRRMIADAKDNDHCTAHPLFVVKRRRVVTGIDTDYTDNIAWIEDGEILGAEESALLEAAYQETGEVPDDYTRTGYCEEWEHIDTYLTEQAALARIDGGPDGRVSVESAYRNKEMQAVRAFLMSLAAAPAPSPQEGR